MPTLILPQSDAELLSGLVEDHLKIERQPLRLAVAYRPSDKPNDLVLFEITGGFGSDRVSEDHRFLEVWVAPSRDFRLHGAQDFYLLLTNPAEFEEASRDGWPQVLDVQRSVGADDGILLHADEIGEEYWRRLGGK